MGRRYDIIQTPKDIDFSSLPPKIEVNNPFMMGENRYVCEKILSSPFRVGQEEDWKIEPPESNKHYYVIRKL